MGQDMWNFRSIIQKEEYILAKLPLEYWIWEVNLKAAGMNMYKAYAITEYNSSFNKYNQSNS